MDGYDKPKSICKCGHTGDGPKSKHEDLRAEDGAGKCKVKGCDCDRFTWKNFTESFAEYIKGGHDNGFSETE
jgi:hypothetical protein